MLRNKFISGQGFKSPKRSEFTMAAASGRVQLCSSFLLPMLAHTQQGVIGVCVSLGVDGHEK